MSLVYNAAAVAVFEIFGGVSETRQSKIGIPADHVGPILVANGPCFLEHLEESAIRLFQTMPLPLEQCPRCTGIKSILDRNMQILRLPVSLQLQAAA